MLSTRHFLETTQFILRLSRTNPMNAIFLGFVVYGGVSPLFVATSLNKEMVGLHLCTMPHFLRISIVRYQGKLGVVLRKEPSNLKVAVRSWLGALFRRGFPLTIPQSQNGAVNSGASLTDTFILPNTPRWAKRKIQLYDCSILVYDHWFFILKWNMKTGGSF